MMRFIQGCIGGFSMVLGVTLVAAQPLPEGLTTNLTLSHDGIDRSYDVYVPSAAADGTERPLVLDLHAFTAPSAVQRMTSGWDELAESEGLILAWPNGLETAWSVGVFDFGVDDVGFLLALVDEISARTAVDPAKVHLTGWSQGGDMVQRVACEATDRFGAFVPFAAGTTVDEFDSADCQPVRPPPILSVRGREDQIIPFDGGTVVLPLDPPIMLETRSAAEQLDFWRDEAQCFGDVPNRTESPGPTTECQAFTQCGAQAEVESCFVSSEAFSGHDLYQNIDALDLAARAWAFMQRNPIPSEFLPFEITEALDGNWNDRDVLLQGLMFDHMPGSDVLFTAWFTYTADVVPSDLPSTDVGVPGQRWLVATLDIDGLVATGTLNAVTGGAFLQPPLADQEILDVGTIEIEFLGCDLAEVRYTLDDAGLAGSFLVEPLAKIVASETFDCTPVALDMN